MAETRYMQLGALRSMQPAMVANFWNPPRTTPQFPQNLLRQTYMGGLGAATQWTRLGAMRRRQLYGYKTTTFPMGRKIVLNGLKSTGRLLYGLGQVAEPPAAADPMNSIPELGANVAVSPTGLELGVEAGAMGTRVDVAAAMGYAAVSLVSAGVAAYHGFRRDKKPMSAVGWGFMGALFPVITPIVAFSQGYARPKGRR